jgi:hypothetical protein
MASAEDNKVPAGVSQEMNWPIVLYYVHLHLGALFGIYYVYTEARVITTLFGKILLCSYK